MGNRSLDFLDMIKNQADSGNVRKTVQRKNQPVVIEKQVKKEYSGNCIAVIDTETNWKDQVMSIGIALADAVSFSCLDKRYYIIDPEVRVGGFYSGVLKKSEVRATTCQRDDALYEIDKYLKGKGVKKIFAYNGKFDLGHLPELGSFEWYDIMRLAAYRQFNAAIPDDFPCCKTGRLKTNYGVEPIMQMLTGNRYYHEVHNAVEDAVDELKIVELLGKAVEEYGIARL